MTPGPITVASVTANLSQITDASVGTDTFWVYISYSAATGYVALPLAAVGRILNPSTLDGATVAVPPWGGSTTATPTGAAPLASVGRITNPSYTDAVLTSGLLNLSVGAAGRSTTQQSTMEPVDLVLALSGTWLGV
jgi:hypothetical protein